MWLRSPKSEWGWLPAKIVKKEVVRLRTPVAGKTPRWGGGGRKDAHVVVVVDSSVASTPGEAVTTKTAPSDLSDVDVDVPRVSTAPSAKAGAAAMTAPHSAASSTTNGDNETTFDILALPGKLRFVLVDPEAPEPSGPALVHTIHNDSPLISRLRLGDKIIAVDDVDVTCMSAETISNLLKSKQTHAERKIAIVRDTTELRSSSSLKDVAPPPEDKDQQQQQQLQQDRMASEEEKKTSEEERKKEGGGVGGGFFGLFGDVGGSSNDDEETKKKEVKDSNDNKSKESSGEPEETMIELTLVDDYDGLLLEGKEDDGVVVGMSPVRNGTGIPTVKKNGGGTDGRRVGRGRRDTYYANASAFTEIIRIETIGSDGGHREEHPDVKLRNTDASDVANASKSGGIELDDLIGLTHLHEPAILHALRLRYDADVIYTSTGPILLAINPFKEMRGVYGTTLMDMYRQRGEANMRLVSASMTTSPRLSPSSSPEKKNGVGGGCMVGGGGSDESFGRRLPPHVYQAADDAYRAMMRGIEMAAWLKGGKRRGMTPKKTGDKKFDDAHDMPANQSILVSGESGAGKTVTTKIVLNYYAMLSRKSQEDTAARVGIPTRYGYGGTTINVETGGHGDESIEHQVLQSNPILEAFGNARTIRNDNSSRFGKYINIAFTETGRLVRASVDTYLLEKVRLLHQAPGERNFHVFYQFLEAATDAEREELSLSGYTYRDFYLMNQSSTYDRRDNVRDADMHAEMVEAMGVMRFGTETVRMLMRLIVAILFAGNMTFSMRKTATYGDAAVLDETEASLAVARLLGVSFANLATSLTSKVIFARGDMIQKGLDAGQAEKANEALIKSMYGAAFDFIAEKINASINYGSGGMPGAAGPRRGQVVEASGPVNIIPLGGASIGVLDIFGFETFESNSYEQFCINYTNETLQQQFNKFVFKLEQQEYEREGILWKFIDFPDNQDVLDLIDKPRTGILQILDEQCLVDWGTERKFSLSLYSVCEKASQRFQVSSAQRVRNKFAVEHYAGLVEYSTENWLDKNKDQLPAACAELLESSDFELMSQIKKYVRSEGAKIATKSLGKQFSDSLKILRTRIDATMPHYVRCLKPNDNLEPDNFDPSNIVEQLRYCGVLEAVRVSRAGYPTRYPHEVFLTRYYIICPNRGSDTDNLSPYHNESSIHLTEEQKQLKRLVSRTATEIWRIEKRSGGKSKPQDNRHALAEPKDLDEFMRLDFSSRCAVAGLQLGKTKVFLRREAFECIESMRNEKFGTNVTKISKNWRCHAAQLTLKRTRHAAISIQCLARMKAATTKTMQLMRDFRLYLKMKVAATKIQRCYRCYHIVTYEEGADLRKAKSSVLKIQGCMRGCLARRQVLTIIYCISKIQSQVRMARIREGYHETRNAIIKIQSVGRVPDARRKLDMARKQRAALKVQAIVRMKSVYLGFRRKVVAASLIKCAYRKHLYQEHAMYGTFLKRYYMLGDPKDFSSKSSLKKKKFMLARHRNAIINAKRLELTKLMNKISFEMWYPGLFESFANPGAAASNPPQAAPASKTAGNANRPPPASLPVFTSVPQTTEEFMTKLTPSRYALVGMQVCHGIVFMRPETHIRLEKRRNDMVGGSSAKIQAVARRKLAANSLKRMRAAAIKIQSYRRMQTQRKELDPKRREFAITKIQSSFRMSTTRRSVWTTYWSTQSRELFAFIGDDNWYMVEKMLHKNPLLVEESDPSTGELPLHKIVERASSWTLLIDMVLTLYPKAVVHKDLSGGLPIHHAAYADNLIGLEIIYESYKNGAKDADASGRFPIHVAAERGSIEAIKYLIMKVPESVHTVTSGGVSLPLHLACKNYSSVGVITSLLRSPLRFSLASRTDEHGELPLHLLLRCGAEVDVVAVKSLLTCHLKAIGARDKSGDSPLHIALKNKCKPAVIETLLTHFPGSSIILDGDGHSPLFLALTHAAEDDTIVSLINYAPQMVTIRDESTNMLPIQAATENEHSLFIVYRLLKRDMPIHLKERVQVRLITHFYSWNHILLDVGDRYYQVVSKILQQCTQPQVLALAHVEDGRGNIALKSATPICRHEIRVMLRLFNTLELVKQRPAFTNGASDTEIFYALRYEPPLEQSDLFSTDYEKNEGDDEDRTDDWDDNLSVTSESSARATSNNEMNLSVADKLKLIRNEKGQHVIAKITPRSDIVERELKIRKDFNLSRHYVPSVISVHHTVHHGAYQNASAEPAYCITMEGADSTAEHQMLDYRRAGKAYPFNELRRIGISLLHLHENGLVHTDFGPHAVGKFGPLFKMLGVGGCVRIGQMTDPTHGIYHSPEAVTVGNVIVDGQERKTATVIPVVSSPAVDLWAFGHMVYESVVGAPLSAYSHRGKRVKSSNLAKIARWDDHSLEKALRYVDEKDVLSRNVIRKLLHPDPWKRFKSIREAIADPFFNTDIGDRKINRNLMQ